MIIRDYDAADAEASQRIFERAISETAGASYTEEQTRAWLGTPVPLPQWNADRLRVRTFVAELDGVIAGFVDVDATGYVDRLFVDPELGRRGVASALLRHVRATVEQQGPTELTTHASLVARPVFERAGFNVEHEELVWRGDVQLTRFFMRAAASSGRLS